MRLLLTVLLGLGLVEGTTLERLSLDEMIAKSTSIVRGKVLVAGAAKRGRVIYTTYKVQVAERIKGQGPAVVEVSVPGGVLGGLHQTIPGAPALESGREYVIFVWTGSTGINHIIGLSQGLFNVTTEGGQKVLSRESADVEMLDATGRTVNDRPVKMSWREMKAQTGRSTAQQ